MSTRRKGPGSLKSIRRKTITLSSENMVEERFLNEQKLPLVVTPRNQDINLPAWCAEHRKSLREKLFRYGAILFRGFKVPDVETFQKTIVSVSGELLNYTERSSPRHSVSGKVYTSTDYPPNQPIFLHNEQSYNLNWCRTISFYCSVAPTPGCGQTPIADTRRILARLEPEVVERFKNQRYVYMRNFGDGFGLEWQTTFGTEDKLEVERYCQSHAIEFEWKDNDRLRTRQIRPALHRHPESGELVWFNHTTFFNVATLPELVRDNLLGEFAETELPNQTFYGDGTSIEADVVTQLQQAYLDEKVLFDWEQGDILVLDNMLTSHGREPFTGDRKILVAMSEPTSNTFEDLGKGV